MELTGKMEEFMNKRWIDVERSNSSHAGCID